MKTKFLYLSLLSMLFVLISTTSVSAQDYNIFAKQKIVIADVRDKSDRPLNDGMHQQIRQQVINACVNSDKYEVSEVNMNDVKKNITSKGLQPTTTNYAPPTQAQRKQVGDIITINGVKAIVFQVDNSGRHRMAMSLEETKCNWDDARKWCSNLGSGWRLPRDKAWEEINRNIEQLDMALSQSGYEGFVSSWYWSEEHGGNNNYARLFSIYNGHGDLCGKGCIYSARAVSAF